MITNYMIDKNREDPIYKLSESLDEGNLLNN